MRRLFLALLLSTALGAAVLAAKEPQPGNQSVTDPAPKPVNKFCPIETENPIDPDGKTVVYNGKTIGFCCADCIKKFQKDPEKYIAKMK